MKYKEMNNLLDWPNSQTLMEYCGACAEYFLGGLSKTHVLTIYSDTASFIFFC